MSHNKIIATVALLAMISLQACAPANTTVNTQRVQSEESAHVLDQNIPEDLLKSQLVNQKCNSTDNPAGYRIGSGDILAVGVFGEKDLSAKYTVNDNGQISMPLIGNVLLSGCTPRQAEEVITAAYADGYLINPSISIEIAQFRPFYILGEVRNPGQYDFGVGINILNAAAIAGGFTYRANQNTAKILRHGVNGQPYYTAEPLESEVQPGDIIIIKERFF